MILDTPEALTNSLHIITIFATPLHILGIYCIVWETPKNMGTANWYLFNLHASCILLDWGFTVLSVPFLILPAMGGYPLGILTYWFGVSALFQIYLIIGLVFGKQIPNLPEEVKAGPLFILAIDYWVLYPLIFMAILTAGGSFTFITLISRNMNFGARKNNLSENTKRLQRKFMKAIYLQVMVFAMNVLCPMSYVVISISTDFYNQMGNNLVFIVAALDGINSTLIMLWAHKPYREVCYNLARRTREKWKMANSKVKNNQPLGSNTVLV
ncbi:hypothetical protein B9Z55_017921 [Caenorhabditis nigoni]|uniref:G-protein coupled receptors family 1 profile domain-containing protein n=1 Tax=Caenorhabditis nigoni TaxID=1611254 RepID=A0A2G5TBD5_9PELO|nr:hypothetical protein B9Z55_017921 [Caenorhabditis nigoni]